MGERFALFVTMRKLILFSFILVACEAHHSTSSFSFEPALIQAHKRDHQAPNSFLNIVERDGCHFSNRTTDYICPIPLTPHQVLEMKSDLKNYLSQTAQALQDHSVSINISDLSTEYYLSLTFLNQMIPSLLHTAYREWI